MLTGQRYDESKLPDLVVSSDEKNLVSTIEEVHTAQHLRKRKREEASGEL